MGALGNTPRRTTVVTLEANKSFAFELEFVHDTGLAYDLTGATTRLVLAQPAHKGGAVVLSKTGVAGDLVNGVVQFELQAADLALAEGEYPYAITLVTAEGYSVPVDKGVFDIRANADTDTTNVYAGVNVTQGLKVTLGTGNRVTVELTALPGPEGPQGTPGTPGADGATGEQGPSAYQVALLNGFVGTEAEWLASLVGPQGPEGAPGTGSVDSVNGFLGPDIVLGAADVGAAPTAHTHDDRYYTEAEVDTLLGSAGGAGLFRGEWASDTVAWSCVDFTALPAALSTATAGPATAAASTVADAGRPNPPASTSALKLYTENSGDSASLTLNIAALGLSNVTRVRAYTASRMSVNSTRFKTLRNAVVVTDVATPHGWSADSVTAIASDTVTWKLNTPGGGMWSQASGYITNIEVYTTADPYMLGEFVTHLGRLWKSNVDNNPGTPGTSGWTEVPIYNTLSARTYSTAAGIPIASTTYVDVDNSMDLVVAAAAGDVLEIGVHTCWNDETSSEGHLNVATIVSNAVVNYVEATGTKGITAWWGRGVAILYLVGPPVQYVVQAGDISNGTVRLRLRAKGSAAATKTLLRGTDFPMRFHVKNLKQ